MDSIRINTGVKRLVVNDDPARVIEFNPEDVLFVERFYELIKVFQQKEVEFQKRIEELKAQEEKDEYGIPVNTPETLGLVMEVCDFLRGQIDNVFGPGTSQAAFAETQSLGMFEQFFAGIAPFIQSSRTEKVAKYQYKKGRK